MVSKTRLSIAVLKGDYISWNAPSTAMKAELQRKAVDGVAYLQRREIYGVNLRLCGQHCKVTHIGRGYIAAWMPGNDLVHDYCVWNARKVQRQTIYFGLIAVVMSHCNLNR